MSQPAAVWSARRDPHLPRWLGRTGLWQAILAATGIAILVVNVIGYRHATADLAEYRAAIRHICVDDEEPGCLYWEQVKVDRVVIETPRRGPNLCELFVVWDDDAPSEIDFASDEPLLHRVYHGSVIWAGTRHTGTSPRSRATRCGPRMPKQRYRPGIHLCMNRGRRCPG